MGIAFWITGKIVCFVKVESTASTKSHKEQFDPNFFINFEVAHLTVLRVQRLLYPEIPTLNGHEELCSALHMHCMYAEKYSSFRVKFKSTSHSN